MALKFVKDVLTDTNHFAHSLKNCSPGGSVFGSQKSIIVIVVVVVASRLENSSELKNPFN